MGLTVTNGRRFRQTIAFTKQKSHCREIVKDVRRQRSTATDERPKFAAKLTVDGSKKAAPDVPSSQFQKRKAELLEQLEQQPSPLATLADFGVNAFVQNLKHSRNADEDSDANFPHRLQHSAGSQILRVSDGRTSPHCHQQLARKRKCVVQRKQIQTVVTLHRR
jgi:hypothetical protein